MVATIKGQSYWDAIGDIFFAGACQGMNDKEIELIDNINYEYRLR